MKKNKNLLTITTTLITFIFFLGFIYFSFLLTKEILLLKYITPYEYIIQNNETNYDILECEDPYSWKNNNDYYYNNSNKGKTYSEEVKIKIKSTDSQLEKQKFAQDLVNYNKKVVDKCLSKLLIFPEKKQFINFKQNGINYALASGFFLLLFLAFTLQSMAIYKKK